MVTAIYDPAYHHIKICTDIFCLVFWTFGLVDLSVYRLVQQTEMNGDVTRLGVNVAEETDGSLRPN